MNRISVLISLIAVVLNGCGDNKDYIVTISTSFGDMKVVLYDETPKHKENFIKLASEGQYDSTIFHRVMSQFMVQGGDVAQKPGFEGDQRKTIPAEFVKKYFHKKGALAAARQPDQVNPDKESSFCQFYIVQGKVWTEEELTTDQQKLMQQVSRLIRMPGYDSVLQVLETYYENQDFESYTKVMMSLKPDITKKLGIDVSKEMSAERIKVYTTIGGYPNPLDDNYTVFGQVVEGLEVIDKIAAVSTNERDKPFEDIYIKMSVDRMPKKKITELYGIQYASEK